MRCTLWAVAGMYPLGDCNHLARPNQVHQGVVGEGARSWKLWLFLPRMLLFRPAGTDRVPKPVILARLAAFFRGDWEPLLRAAIAGTSAPARPTTNTTDTDDLPRRLERATRLAHLGELSAARQALTSEPLAPPTEATLQQLTDPSRRPAEPTARCPKTSNVRAARSQCTSPKPGQQSTGKNGESGRLRRVGEDVAQRW